MPREEHDPLRRLRIAALIEGATLLTLVGVAVPLKHLLGLPVAVAVAGPIHGLAFTFYLWIVANTAAGEDWSTRETALAVAAAILPFGAFANAEFLQRKKAETDRSCSI